MYLSVVNSNNIALVSWLNAPEVSLKPRMPCQKLTMLTEQPLTVSFLLIITSASPGFHNKTLDTAVS